MFKIVSESSVAAGVRRIEAITGKNYEETMYAVEDTLKDIKTLFNNAKDLKGTIRKFIEEDNELKKQVESFKAKAIERTKEELVKNAVDSNGIKIVKGILPVEASMAKDIVFKVREAIPQNLICVIGSTFGDKPLLSIMLSDDMVKLHNLNAGKIIREAAKLIQGGGGGQPHYAQAGGKNINGLSDAVEKVVELCLI
jgi:alanyl-tRNA synthetase